MLSLRLFAAPLFSSHIFYDYIFAIFAFRFILLPPFPPPLLIHTPFSFLLFIADAFFRATLLFAGYS